MTYAARVVVLHQTDPIPSVPANVLIALGISLNTAISAQAITSSQVAANGDAKSANPTASYDPSALTSNDDATTPSLTKVQLLF